MSRHSPAIRTGRRALVALTVAVTALVAPGAADAALPQQTGNVDLLDQANVTLGGADAGDQAGWSVAPAGDVNGDGLDDVVIGAPGSLLGTGAVSVVYGSASVAPVDLTDPGSRGFRITGSGLGSAAGTAVGGGGDVNGDGLDDVVIGAPGSLLGAGAGAAYVVFGARGTPGAVSLGDLGARGFAITGVAGEDFGRSVALLDDMSRDRRSDVAVGAPGAAGGAGKVSVVFGRTATDPVEASALGTAGFTITGPAGASAGRSVAGARDLDADDRGEVLVGAPGANAAYVVYGKEQTDDVALDGLAADATGLKITGAGALTGEGVGTGPKGELYVAAKDGGAGDAGSAFALFPKRPLADIALPPADPLGFGVDGVGGELLDRSVSGLGDFDGDGTDDLIAGAQCTSTPERTAAGAAYIVSQSPLSSVATDALTGRVKTLAGPAAVDGACPDSFFGTVDPNERRVSVASARDFNGDGRPDALVGFARGGTGGAGSAYVVFGFGRPAVAYSGGSISGTVGSAITPLTATATARTGTVAYTIAPALPAGLSLDAATGRIAGTPTATQASTVHTVTMTDLAGATTASITVAVRARPVVPPPTTTPTSTTPPPTPTPTTTPTSTTPPTPAPTPTTPSASTPQPQPQPQPSTPQPPASSTPAETPAQGQAASTAAPDLDRDGTPDARDCAPRDPGVHPSATEVTDNGKDDDCDGIQAQDRDKDKHLALPLGDDCDDKNRRRYPGNKEIAGNGRDEDCSGADTLALLRHVTIDAGIDELPNRRNPRKFRLRTFKLTKLLAGARITFTCTGRGCPTQRRRSITVTKAHAAKGLSLSKYFRRYLLPGARISFKVTKSGYRGRTFTLRFAAGKQPAYAERCIAISGKASSCP